jgi:tryptophan-rich sensory protein
LNNQPSSKALIWTGRVMSGLAAIFLLWDGVMKLFKPVFVVEATVRLGYPESTIIGIGVILVVCTIIYIIPQTSVVGAILLTGYLGGAVATQVRAGGTLFTIIFPVIMGALVWGGLFLRENRLRALIPLVQ